MQDYIFKLEANLDIFKSIINNKYINLKIIKLQSYIFYLV